MSAPTPGPWRLQQNGAGQWCVIGAGELVVCMFPPIVAEIADEQMANMGAIVAASQMLVALRVAEFVIRNTVEELEECGGYLCVVDAISKATSHGEKP